MFRKPSPALIVALLALFVALGGPAGAAKKASKLISGSKLKTGTVTSKQIKQRTITSGDIAAKTLKSLKAKTNAVTTAQIVDGTVSLADMAFGSVTGNQVVDRSLTGVDVAADSIGAGELAVASVGNAELGADAVTNNKIATSAVSKGSLRGSAVGTGEVIDRDLTGVDIAKASGKINASFAPIAGNACSAPQTFSGTTYAIPAGAVGGTVVLANAPIDGVHVNARATDANTISLQVCNDTASEIPAITGKDFPYVAIAP